MNAKDIISEACGLSQSQITVNSKLSDPIEWDSLAQLMIIASIEEHIGRDLTMDEFEQSRSYLGVEKLLN
tara:strand:+ start:2152 stop:2361 length:210 start_codon:yes stop_codon:yes gene_type:complete